MIFRKKCDQNLIKIVTTVFNSENNNKIILKKILPQFNLFYAPLCSSQYYSAFDAFMFSDTMLSC